jgi:hypothetical protein
MNDRDQSVAILAEIENYVPLDVIGILEDLLHIHEIPPPGRLRDLVPGLNLLSGVGVLFFSFDQMLAGDDVHGGTQKSPTEEPAPQNALHSLRYFANCKVSRKTFQTAKLSRALRLSAVTAC